MPPRLVHPVAALLTELKPHLTHLLALPDPATVAPEDVLADRDVIDQALDACADLLARYARAAQAAGQIRYPEKAAVAVIRQNVAEARTLDGRSVRELLRVRVKARLERVASALPPTERGVDEREMADLLGIPFAELQALLLTVAGRRGLWFPIHVGDGRFRWPRALLTDPPRADRPSGVRGHARGGERRVPGAHRPGDGDA